MKDGKVRRQIRVRSRLGQVSVRPRFTVFRSNKYCYAQIVDKNGNTVLGLSEKALKETKGIKPVEAARQLGVAIAKMALDKKIKEVAFDKGRFAYHGRVKAVAEGAREGGLSF